MRISDWSSDVCSSDLYWLSSPWYLPHADATHVVCATDCGRCASLIACRHEQASYRSFFIDRQLAQRVLGLGREEVGGTSLRHPESQRHIRRSEEHTSELQSLMRISYAVFCLKKKKKKTRSYIIKRRMK